MLLKHSNMKTVTDMSFQQNKNNNKKSQHNTTPSLQKTCHWIMIMFHVFFLWCCCVVLFLSALWISMLCFFLSPALQGTTGLYSSASHGPLTKKVITGQKTLGGDGPLGQAFGTAAGRCSEKQKLGYKWWVRVNGLFHLLIENGICVRFITYL